MTIPSAAFFSLQQKAVSIRAVQILCAESGSKCSYAMPASPGISLPAGQAVPALGLGFVWVKLCLPSLPSALCRVLVHRPNLFPAIPTLLSPTLWTGSRGYCRAPGKHPLGSCPHPCPNGALQLHCPCLGLQLTTHSSSTFSFSSHNNARDLHAITTPQALPNRRVKGILTGSPLETQGLTRTQPV